MSLVVAVHQVSKRFDVEENRPRTLKESVVRTVAGKRGQKKTIWALRDVSFEVMRGQTLGIIGHNGAGKSTLLRLLCGIGRPTSGKITCQGTVAGLLQLSTFHPLLTGRENIRTASILSGLTRNQAESLEETIISFSELEEFIDQPVRTYSDGMTLRLAFSAAVHLDPDLLIIDEILTVGDIGFEQKCKERLKSFKSSGKTIILSSHEMEQVRSFCDEVMVLDQGKILFHTDPESAIRNYHDLMRQRTEARAQQISVEKASIDHPAEQGSRTGTHEAMITAVRFQNEAGNDSRDFQSGSKLTIKMDLSFMNEIKDVAASLGIFTEKDVKCFEASIPSLKSLIGTFNGSAKVHCTFPALPLLPGRYYVNIGLFPTNWEFIYDYHWQMHSFDILGKQANVTGILSVNPVFSGEA